MRRAARDDEPMVLSFRWDSLLVELEPDCSENVVIRRPRSRYQPEFKGWRRRGALQGGARFRGPRPETSLLEGHLTGQLNQAGVHDRQRASPLTAAVGIAARQDRTEV